MSTRALLAFSLVLAACPDTDKSDSDAADTAADTAVDTAVDTDTDSGCVDSGELVYEDADGDGFGAGSGFSSCDTPPPHPVDNADDCDDGNAEISPASTETCNGIDDNCDGTADEGMGSDWFPDGDADGFGDPRASTYSCVAPDGYVADGSDCDDTNAAVNPTATELCSGVDEDCDGTADDPQTATYVEDDGTVRDVSSLLAAGTAVDPAFIGDQTGYELEVTSGTVYLCEGTWHAKIVLAKLGSELSVVGPAGPDATTLTTGGTTGGSTGSVIAITDTQLTVRGLTITGGIGSEDGTKGGGIAVAQAGAAASQPNVTLHDTIITGNRTAYGGGVALKDFATMALYDSLIVGNEATSVGGGVWVQTYGALTCEASALGAAGILDNTAPIAGGYYFSSKNDGTLETTGCDWGESGVDDNSQVDIDRQPHQDNEWCFGNAAALSDSVYCDPAGCTGTSPIACP
jgi:hypothetical protein